MVGPPGGAQVTGGGGEAGLAEAALLLGAVEHHAAAPAYGDEAARLSAVTDRLVKLLGQGRMDAQFAAGARLSLDEAAQLTLAWLPAAAATAG